MLVGTPMVWCLSGPRFVQLPLPPNPKAEDTHVLFLRSSWGSGSEKRQSRKKERIGFLFSGFLIIACDVSATHNVISYLVSCPVSS